MESNVFDIATFVTDFFYPSIAIGCILPAGAAMASGFVRFALVAFGLLVSE